MSAIPDNANGEFTCECCERTFTKAWSDEDALAEAARIWTPEEMAAEGPSIICDECFGAFMAWRGDGPGHGPLAKP